jgi:hypothetical protein
VTKSEEASSLAPETVSIQVVVLETASLIPLATGTLTKKPAASPKSDRKHYFSLRALRSFSETFTKEDLD